MNWDIFSTIGYASIALWLCMPLLWALHMLWRPRRWWCHVALLLGVAALVLAKINSQSYVNRIQVDRSQQIDEQLARQEMARQAATEARLNEVAPIRFAEDGAGEFLDKAGMDEAELKYLQSFDDEQTPDWKMEKKQRTAGAEDDSLEAMIGAAEDAEGVASDTLVESEATEPIWMSARDKQAAHRLDAANLSVIRVLLGLGVVIVVVDYLRRANVYNEAYCPLPLPSSWVDAMTPRDSVTVRAAAPRRSLLQELHMFTRRGEPYVYMTDDEESAARAAATAYRRPLRLGRVEVLAVGERDAAMDDDFVFETLWYNRNSFVVDAPDRAQQMLRRFVELLAERRSTRARTRRTVQIVWDISTPIPAELRHQLATLGRATGFALLLCREERQTEG